MIPLNSPERGHLQGKFPYVRLGGGPRTLLVVPGIGDAMSDGNHGPLVARGLQLSLRRFLDDYTVYLVSRPRGLDPEASIGEMAAGYAGVLERLDLGPASVIGLSMGGLIGQDLARRRPDLVKRLVVAVSGCRLAAEGESIVRELRQYSLDREWTKIRARLLEAMYTGVRRAVYPRVVRAVGRVRPPQPAEPRDVTVSIDAALDFDGTDRLEAIEAPTLVVGGSDDPFFPERILRETARGIDEAQLVLFHGDRHGAFLEHKKSFDDAVLHFLDGEPLRAALSG